MFGHQQATAVAEDIEVRSRAGDLDDLDQSISSLQNQVAKLTPELDKFTAEQSAP